MRQKGSVTVFFSLVFMVLFSFILSFFEMAAYTARASYHASAALLAVENYFAAYLNPLYEEYHIFGREVPDGEDIRNWTKNGIADDVSYMTVKQEGEKSLLLRSGAEFDVTSVSVLTDNKLEGFYTQAITAMKYRAAPEVITTLAEFAGMTEQANAHLEIAAAKAATDSAYAKVDEKILHLIELVDGVDIVRYEKFMNGKGVLFQKDAFVKYFCTDPAGAANYFDRTQVYQAFLNNFENPCETLDSLSARAETLATEIEEREREEMICRSRLAEVRGRLSVVSPEISELSKSLAKASIQYTAKLSELGKLILKKGNEEEVAELSAQVNTLEKSIEEMQIQKQKYEEEEKQLKKEEGQLEDKQTKLDKKKKAQEKQVKALRKEEEKFVRQCETVRDICDEAYEYVKEVQEELERAKKVKKTCETILDSLQVIIGEEAVNEYRAELDTYLFYEDLDGFEFEQMKQTLLENKSRLWNISMRIEETNLNVLRNAVKELQRESDTVSNYSFVGLKLNYGEMSLAENIYDGVESMISKEVASGFLGFLTEEEISEKELDLSYLPSGFRYEEEGFDIFSLLGTDMSGIFEELQTLLPEDFSLKTIGTGVSDTVLFHAYVATHFDHFFDENGGGALSYEQEYLIAGKATDQENLSSVAMRICALRTILHFVSLYTDSARKAPVEQAALAACGIIGLPALKSIVVFLLLFVWALEEAMIDTAAFLFGKRLLLYPGKTGGSLAFSEILMFSKTFVLEKAKQKKNGKGLSFGYNEYLHLFLFLTPKEDKKYRAADLIQENLRKTYRESFRINRCVWEMSYRTDRRDYEYSYK